MERISKHITYAEAVKSQTAVRYGIDNTPAADTLIKMRYVAEETFEPTRLHFNGPLYISSFFRCETLNARIGGASSSQHVEGEAIDIDGDVFDTASNKQIFAFIYNNLHFDQLIWEYGTDNNPDWVHVSKTMNHDRNQVLRAVRGRGYVELSREDIEKLLS